MSALPVSRIAVLGAGTMGHGIAHAAVAAGYETRVFDPVPTVLQRAVILVDRLLDQSREAGTLSQADVVAARGRLETTVELADAVSAADLVIEAVPERVELKLELLGGMEWAAPEHAVFATNTSSLSITELAAALKRPSRLGGMHFFNPVHRMRLVEVVRALDSAPETIATIEAVAQRMGKETVVVRESAGFVTSRISALIGNEAFHMLEAGVATAPDIDRAVRLGLNHPMGPFELVDLVGLDTRLSVLEHLHRTFGEKFRPCPLLVQYVRAGRLGRKVGRGVYDYGPRQE